VNTGGMINKFLGDGFHGAFLGVDNDEDNHADKALGGKGVIWSAD